MMTPRLVGQPVRLVAHRPWWAFWRRRRYSGIWIVESINLDPVGGTVMQLGDLTRILRYRESEPVVR